jgi:hypothetical protein
LIWGGRYNARARAQPPPPPRWGRAPGSNGPSGPPTPSREPKQGRGPHRSRRPPTSLPGLRCGTRLAHRVSPPRRPTPVVRSEGGGGAHEPLRSFLDAARAVSEQPGRMETSAPRLFLTTPPSLSAAVPTRSWASIAPSSLLCALCAPPPLPLHGAPFPSSPLPLPSLQNERL